MQSNIYLFLFLVVSCFTFAQNKEASIETRIKNVIENSNFLPETTNGTNQNVNGKEIPFNTSYYYHLNDEKLFSVIYQEHDEISLNKTFYYENDQVVLIVIEKINNKLSKDRIVEQIMYYFENNQQINISQINENYNADELLKEAEKYKVEFYKPID